MKKKPLPFLGITGLLLVSSGCASSGGITSAVGPLLNMAFYAALLALPFLLSYYLYYRD